MLLKLSSRFLTLALFLGSLSYSAFSMETRMPSLFKTKDEVRLSLWYEGIYEQEEVQVENTRDFTRKMRKLPVELSHPLNNWNL